MRIASRTSATAVTLSSSATYASIVPGTAVARRRRASDPSAPAGVVTARTRPPVARRRSGGYGLQSYFGAAPRDIADARAHLPAQARRDNMRGSAMDSGSAFSDEVAGPAQEDLRHRIAAVVQDRANVLVWDTVAIFPFIGTELLEPDYCNRIGEVVVRLLI